MFQLRAPRSKHGVSLIEVLVGIAISGIVILAVASAYEWIFKSIRSAEIKSTVQDLNTEASYRILTSQTLMHSISKAAELPSGINGLLAGCLIKEEGDSPTLCPSEAFRIVLVPGKPAGLKYAEHRFSGMGPGYLSDVRVFYSRNGARCNGLSGPTDQCPIEVWSEAQCRYPNCGATDQAERMNITVHIDVTGFGKQKAEMVLDSTKGQAESGWVAISPKETIDQAEQWASGTETGGTEVVAVTVAPVTVTAKNPAENKISVAVDTSGTSSASLTSNDEVSPKKSPHTDPKHVTIDGTKVTPTPLPEVKITDTRICDPSSYPFGGGDGSFDNPYRICHTEQWMQIYLHPKMNFILTKNLDLTAVSNRINALPEKPWEGSLNGNENILFSLELTPHSKRQYSGLFPRLSKNTAIESLSMKNFKIPTREGLCSGWLAGQADQSVIIKEVTYTGENKSKTNIVGCLGAK